MKKNITKEKIEKLRSENRYFELSNINMVSFKKTKNFESILETGKKFNSLEFGIRDFFIYRNVKNMFYKPKKIFKYALGLIAFFTATTLGISELDKSIMSSEEKEIVLEYDKKLEEYVSKFDTNTMSTLEIIMTVMNDIRSNTRFGKTDVDVAGYNFRLALNDENDIGVCRHMADKFTTIMNMIDPRFDAHNFLNDLNQDCEGFVLCNIEHPTLKPSTSASVIPKKETLVDKIKDKLDANHMISILKPIDANYYLAVDVTNPSIGVIVDGEIYMFNSNSSDFVDYRPLSQMLFTYNSFQQVNRELILSYFRNIDLNELNEEYGLEAQNKVLEKIKD